MALGQLIPIRVGDVELLAETVRVAGTEPTAGRAQRVAEQAGEAFTRAQETIVEVARSTAQMIETAGAKAARPDRVEVEFGLSFSATGGIVMMAVTGEATLRVTLVYDAKARSPGRGTSPGPPPPEATT